MFFHSSLSTNHSWFPETFPEQNLVECGLNHDIHGFSVIDNYLYQFEKCSVIIYPPPLDKHLDKNFNHLKLDNGYRFTFENIQPDWKPNYCEKAQSSKNKLQYLLVKQQNEILLYFLEFLSSNKSIQYHVYDFNTNTDSKSELFAADDIYEHYLLMTNGKEQFTLHNSMGDKRFYLARDPLKGRDSYQIGHICIRQTDVTNKKYLAKITVDKHCASIDSLMKTIVLSFTVNGKLLIISKEDKIVLITDVGLLHTGNDETEYPFEVKDFKDFFTCKYDPKNTKQPNDQGKITESTTTKNTGNILIILLVLLFAIIFIVSIIIFTKSRKKKLNDATTSQSTSLSTTIPKKMMKKNMFDTTIRSPMSRTTATAKTTNR